MGQFVDPYFVNQTPATHEAPVDLVHLARHTFGDADLEREVLQLFMTQSRIYLNRLKEARDVENWRRAAHTIKGSARGIGAWAVAERAQTAELLGHNVDEERCRMAIAALEREVDAANGYIRSLFVEH
ncbi:Hpt domain-containing protein [Microbaculum sp. FT89]|uniref:Hpt domain-containing protein n=1 Tax=Microbaculum sp. FT89 TaxID=3447298 RepID=UPI003F53A45D